MNEIARYFSFPRTILDAADVAEKTCATDFERFKQNASLNNAKVLAAFIKNHVSAQCLCGTTGYGYDDMGRDTLDCVAATIFGTQAALVRHNFVSGTHALTVALFGILRTGDTMVCLTGTPYDTLHGVIGLNDDTKSGSLKNYGIHYKELPLLPDGTVDYDGIPEVVRGCRIAYLQRSRGYSLRDALTIDNIAKIVSIIRKVNPEAIIMIDNCYGEFVETCEPADVGCDLVIGSMIKNVGGGIARTGGYIAGRQDLVDACAERLTCIGMGSEVGCTLDMNRELYLGLFHAPETTCSALMTADFAAAFFAAQGYKTSPNVGATRGDIVQAIELGDENRLIAFCRGIQSAAPIDSFVTPEPAPMPGYDSNVIMAAGTFTMGASVELSADAPLREPYAVWMQGAMNYTVGKIGVLSAANTLLGAGLLTP